jgi:hypothetical protein
MKAIGSNNMTQVTTVRMYDVIVAAEEDVFVGGQWC